VAGVAGVRQFASLVGAFMVSDGQSAELHPFKTGLVRGGSV